MFERSTADAGRIVVLVVEVAEEIGPEHVLLELLRHTRSRRGCCWPRASALAASVLRCSADLESLGSAEP
jgi:hypothetical protein